MRRVHLLGVNLAARRVIASYTVIPLDVFHRNSWCRKTPFTRREVKEALRRWQQLPPRYETGVRDARLRRGRRRRRVDLEENVHSTRLDLSIDEDEDEDDDEQPPKYELRETPPALPFVLSFHYSRSSDIRKQSRSSREPSRYFMDYLIGTGARLQHAVEVGSCDGSLGWQVTLAAAGGFRDLRLSEAG